MTMAMYTSWQRRVSRRGALLTGGAAAFLAACGGGDKQTTNQTVPGAAVPTTGPRAVDAEDGNPVQGGTLRYRATGDYPTLDPFKSASFEAQYHGGFIHGRLLALKSGPGVDPRNYEVAPDVALSHETPDGLTHTFKLRPNTRFHNVAPVSGRAVDAADVKFSYERFISVSPNQNVLKNLVESMETPDPLTVVMKLKLRYAPFTAQIASATDALWIFPKEAEGYDPAKVQIGTGPFLLEKDTPSVNTIYKRNPTWWWQGRPFPETVQRIVIPEQAQHLAQFIAKRVDTYAPTNINQEILDIRKQVPEVNAYKDDIATGFSMIYFSGQEPDSPFRDVRVRRAVSMAMDRDELLDSVSNASALAKAGSPIESAWNNALVSPGWGKWWLNPKDASFKEGQWYKFDVKEAKALLSAAGFPNGFKTEFHFTPVRYGQNFDTWSEALIEVFKQIGLDLDVKVDDYNHVYFPEVFTKGNFKGMAWGPQSGFNDIDGIIFNMAHPNGIRNHSKINQPGGTLFQDNGRLTSMVEAQRAELDAEKRKTIIHEIQRYCSDQMVYVPAPASANFQRFTLSWPWLRNNRVYRSVSYGAAMEAWSHWWIDEEKRKQMGG
jgi:peptide/nickel transport system substrate-binding protein